LAKFYYKTFFELTDERTDEATDYPSDFGCKSYICGQGQEPTLEGQTLEISLGPLRKIVYLPGPNALAY
jgi:hypothetical protein